MSKLPRITPEELLEKIESNANIVILDVRTEKEYRASNQMIQGAVRKNPEIVESWVGELREDPEYITYCT